MVADTLLVKLFRLMTLCKHHAVSGESLTYVPYYDSILEKKQRDHLCNVKMNTLAEYKVKLHSQIRHQLMKDEAESPLTGDKSKSSENLIEYMPQKDV